jgi:hypothetical protein
MVKKRRTPVDDPKIVDEWKEFYKEYKDMGLSDHQVYKQISAHFNCSTETVRIYLRPDVRQLKIKRQKKEFVPYRFDPRKEYRRVHNRIYQDIRRNIEIYLKEIYCRRDDAFSLDEITNTLSKLTGIEMRNKTFIRILDHAEKKYGKKILTENGRQPPKYRFLF